jgi:hypothetical protein
MVSKKFEDGSAIAPMRTSKKAVPTAASERAPYKENTLFSKQ